MIIGIALLLIYIAGVAFGFWLIYRLNGIILEDEAYTRRLIKGRR